MADLKISNLTAAGSVDPDDLLASVDVSDTTMNASGTTKKTTRELLQTYNAGTLTTDKKVLDLSATWNASGVTFTGVKFNVTNTASAAASKVFDFQIGGTSALVLDKSGNLLLGTSLGVGSNRRLEVGATSNTTNYIRINSSSVGTALFEALASGTASALFGVNASGSAVGGVPAGTMGIGSASAYPITFTNSNIERLRITDTGLVTFGGATSSFPALKRSSTTLQVRLADDSGDAPFSSGRATIQTLTVGLGGQTSVASNTAVGYAALNSASLTGTTNSAFGYAALINNTTGNGNSAFGYQSLANNTTGANNVGCGYATLINNTTGNNNTAVGLTSMGRFNTGNNVAVGFEALRGGDATVANNTGANNIAVGYRAGDAITTGSNNIVIGYDIDPDSATGSNQINIGDRYFHDRIRLLERTSDPAKPTEGNMIVWMSDGTGLGDDGDVIIASTAGGVTNYAILFDHSAGTLWP